MEINETAHQYLNHTFYFPARAVWSEVTITLVDPATPDAIGNLHRLLERSGYIIPANPNMLASISKDRAVSQAGGGAPQGGGGDIEINQLDAQGNTSEDLILERWTLRNAWIRKITPSEVAYDNDELASIDIVIRYDFAELKVLEFPEVIHLPRTEPLL